MEAGPAPEPREQAKQVREVVQRRSDLREGDAWYVLSMRWWDVWKDYTRYSEESADSPRANGSEQPPQRRQLSGATHGSRPPSIDNSELTAGGSSRLRHGLEEYRDFVLVQEPAWQLLDRWYGGGPPLRRSVVSVGTGSSAELRVELYPLWLTVCRVDAEGKPDRSNPQEVCFARSGRVELLLQEVCDRFKVGLTERGEDLARLWRQSPSQAGGSAGAGNEIPSLDGWEVLASADRRPLGELGLGDSTELLLELSQTSRQSYKTVITWPFFRSLRIAYKKKAFKDPSDPAVRLSLNDQIDASVESTSENAQWYPATVVGEEEDRVLVEFHGRDRPKMKLPPIVTEGSWISGERQLTPESKTAFETVFKRYATDGKIDKAAMRGLLSCATNQLVREDSYQVGDLLTKYGDGTSVELDGFLKYWRQKAVSSSSYLLEEEAQRLFERVGAATAAQTEDDKLLAQGREWILRGSERLAHYRSKEYPYSLSRSRRGFRDFQSHDNLDASFGGVWKQAEITMVNWEEMAVLVQARESSSSYSSSYNGYSSYNRGPKEWIPMESDRLTEYQTKSLEAAVEDSGPLLARTVSKGGACSRPGACGLQNLGNTCFMNSTLQCLSNCSALRFFFAGGPDTAPPYQLQISSSPLSHNGRLAREFSRLLCQMWSNSHESCAPAELKSLVGQKRPEFSGYQQQDAQELLIFLLDGLHEDTNRAKYPRPVVPEVESNGRPAEEVAQMAWSGHLQRNDSRIVELFQFQIRSEVECPVCRNVSVTFDPIMYLSLPVPKPPHSVAVTVVTADYPRSGLLKIEVPVAKSAAFEELEQMLWERLRRSPGSPPLSRFVFADVWSDRVYKMFPSTSKISDIQHGDSIYAMEALLPAGAELGEVTFVPVIFRKQKTHAYTTSSYTTFDRVAPPRVVAVSSKTTNAAVHEQLSVMAQNILSATEQDTAFDLVCQIDTYASVRGETLADGGEPFGTSAAQLHVGVNFMDAEVAATVQSLLPKVSTVKGDGPGSFGGTTLHQCLLKNAEREQLAEEDAVYCRKCKEHRRCWKKIDIWSLPSQLIVHLKRFGRDRIDGPLTKITTPVDFATELDLSPYLARAHEGVQYDLYGVVNHHGGLGGGHYTAHALVTTVSDDGSRPCEGEWFQFNDARATKAAVHDLDQAAGYILFYRRREQERRP